MQVSILIGSTGYVGSQLLKSMSFDKVAHKSDVFRLSNSNTDLFICAGMPAAKWIANSKPDEDFENMNSLWEVIRTIRATIPILISTIDVYGGSIAIDESDLPSINGSEAYGSNRAILENRFNEEFSHGHIIRLPGLFSKGLRKNLIFDLLNSRDDQYMKVNAKSRYQFFNLDYLPEILEFVISNEIRILNVSSEPIEAQEIAKLFGVTLLPYGDLANYDMQTRYGRTFGGKERYLYSKDSVLSDIEFLMRAI